MKDYIFQFYNDGFATTFYLKPIKWIKKKIKNKFIADIVTFLIKFIYTIVVIIFALFIFYKKWSL